MFERRLKIFLGILVLVTAVIALRAGQVQVVEKEHWRRRAADAMTRTRLIETVRGQIIDCNGLVIAEDRPCVDVCVDYRALISPPDEKWVKTKALERLRLRMGDAYAGATAKRRKELRTQEELEVKADIEQMWVRLPQVARRMGRKGEDVEETRRAIINRVSYLRRLLWYRTYAAALEQHEKDRKQQTALWRRWLLDDANDGPDVDSFSVDVAEQAEAHVIMPAVDLDAQNELGKHIERYPGLVLRAGTRRYYPWGDAACHVIGHLAPVTREDREDDPNGGVDGDDLRRYLPNDLIGRTGLESLCESALRGTRGRSETAWEGGQNVEVGRTPERTGRAVRTTIDVALQQQIQEMFAKARVVNADKTVDEVAMHGAAVVIDVKTGHVRALASYPVFDLNRFDELYEEMSNNELDKPMLNRATQSQLEPGSTIKPVVGLAAITQGLIGVEEPIECTGYLMLGGRQQPRGRCWVASKFSEQLGGRVAHHPVPWNSPHPTGMLIFADALERSCNIYFETLGDRMKIEGLSDWYDRFGLGRPTGVGIPESRGLLPKDFKGRDYLRRMTSWFSAIGQVQVAATPVQMANVAATIARDGVWLRPRLVADAGDARPVIDLKTKALIPDRVDLKLSREGLAAAKDGMLRVVRSDAGTGKALVGDDAVLKRANIAGKTGTAQAARFKVTVRDTNGQVVREKSTKPGELGKPKKVFLEPSTPDNPNLAAPWYRGTGKDNAELNHAWYIGFAPADDPQIAFAVLVEYGGSGGGPTCAGIAKQMLGACIEQGHLTVKPEEGEIAIEAAAGVR